MTRTKVLAKTGTQPLLSARTATILLVALIGIAVTSVAGHVQATALHDAAHDVRHATGFPCH